MIRRLALSPTAVLFLFLAVVELALLPFITERDLFLFSQKFILGILCLSTLVLGFRERFVFNPFLCFFLFPFSLLIYDSSVSSRFLTPLDLKVYALGVSSVIAFMLGVVFITSKMEPEYMRVAHIAPRTPEMDRDYTKVGLILVAIWFVSVVARKVLHIPIPFAAIFLQLVYVGMAFLLMSRRKSTYLLVVLIAVLSLAASFRKTYFLMLFSLFFMSMLNGKFITRKKGLLALGILFLGGAFMIFVAYPLKIYSTQYEGLSGFEFSWENMNAIMEADSVRYGYMGSGFFNSLYLLRPYLTMTTEWTNLNYVLDTQRFHTYGMWFLKPILNIMQFNTENWSIYTLVPRSEYYNTFGLLTTQVKDFGFPGCVVLTFLEGLLTGWCFKRFREHANSPIETVRYVYIATATFETFFSNHFLLGGIHIIFIVTWSLLWVLKRTNFRLYEALHL